MPNELPVDSVLYIHIDDKLIIGPFNQDADIGIDINNNLVVNSVPYAIDEYILFQIDENASVEDGLQIGLIAGLLTLSTANEVDIHIVPQIIDAEHPRLVIAQMNQEYGDIKGFEGYAEL